MLYQKGLMDYNLLQTAALIAAVFVAYLAISKKQKISNLTLLTQQDIAKQNKTIELLMKDLEDDFLTEGLNILRKVDEEYHIEDFAKQNKKKTEEAIAIRNLLNYYEIIGVGVEADIYDVIMIRNAQKTMILRIYEQAVPFINRSRTQDNNPNLWVKFEYLVSVLKAEK